VQLCFLHYFKLDGIQSAVLRPLAVVMAELLEKMTEDLWRMSGFQILE